MPQDGGASRGWLAPLAGRLPADADVAQLAAAVLAVWAEIDAALQPVIGPRGVAALYNRSVALATTAHPWLPRNAAGLLAPLDAAALQAALLLQTVDEAAAAGSALFQNFHTLLASLVGASLTDRLLVSVWAHPSPASPAQDSPT